MATIRKRGDKWEAQVRRKGARPVSRSFENRFDGIASVTICVFITDETDAPPFRLPIHPSERNGLPGVSRLVDKLTTVPKGKLGEQVGYRRPPAATGHPGER
jgi:mRNA interferase MazF